MKLNKNIENKIDSFVDKNKQSIINVIKELVKQNTIFDEKTLSHETPYGVNIDKGFKLCKSIFKKFGFTDCIKDKKNKFIYVNYEKHDPKKPLVLFAIHIDTVPVDLTEKWETGSPFDAKIIFDYMYGRGVLDDKGPLSCVIHALFILKKLKVSLPFNLEVFIGGDEETELKGQQNYINLRNPFVGLIADGNFPMIIGEQSINFYDLEIEEMDSVIDTIKVNNSMGNVVPSKCEIVLNVNLDQINYDFDDFLSTNNLDGTLEKLDSNKTKLTIIGKSGHAAYPENGINAVTFAFTYLSKFDLNSRLIIYINHFFHEQFQGDNFEINSVNPEYNQFTHLNLACVTKNTTNNTFKLLINIRFDNSKITNEIINNQINNISKNWLTSFKLNLAKESRGFLNNIEDKRWTFIHDQYKEIFKQPTAKPSFSSGGSYARCFPNSINLGILAADLPYTAHCNNEKVPVHCLIDATKFYAKLLYRLAINFNKIYSA